MIGMLPQKVYFSPLNLKKILQTQRNMYKILKKSLLALMFSIPLLFSSYQAEATHVMGADITYKCIDTLKFEIVVKYYRWCGGVGFSNPSSATKIRCASGGSANV